VSPPWQTMTYTNRPMLLPRRTIIIIH